MAHKIVVSDSLDGYLLSPLGKSELYKRKYPEIKLFFYERYDKYKDHTYVYFKCNPEDADFVSLIDRGEYFKADYMLELELNDYISELCAHTPRHDPDLVEVIEKFGSKATIGDYPAKIVEIDEDEYFIVHLCRDLEGVVTPNSIKWVKI